MIKLNAYAKINLFLDIVSRRYDGFHDIVSYMQTVSLCDEVSLEKADAITVIGNPAVPQEKDLTYKAAKLFFEQTGIDGGVVITLQKRIPMQGGLAGGSADAAAVLRGLNELYETELDDNALRRMALTLGSDVPFCVSGGSMLAYGRGERLTDAPPMPDCGIVIVAGRHGCSTPAQFAALDSRYDDFYAYRPHSDRLDRLGDAAEQGDIRGVSAELFNIFEETDGYDAEVAHRIKQTSALGVLMSGSGSSIFGLYENENEAELAASKLRDDGYNAVVCKPIGI